MSASSALRESSFSRSIAPNKCVGPLKSANSNNVLRARDRAADDRSESLESSLHATLQPSKPLSLPEMFHIKHLDSLPA